MNDVGVNIKGLYEPAVISLDSLAGKIVAVDAYNMLYQFLTTIRGYDGAALVDSKGRVTSHLQGLFSRVTALMQKDIKLVFVFDGPPPALKASTLDARKERKNIATKKYAEALASEDVQGMHTYAKQSVVLTKEMAAQAKDLLRLLGIPVIEAPCEGEAQAAHMCVKGDVDFVSSQDADALLFGAPVTIRNLSIYGRRKLPGKSQWVVVEPQKIVLDDVLKTLSINQQQLIWLGMLVGTDYAPGGIKGIGPKNALKMVRQFQNPDDLFREVAWSEHQEVSWQEVLSLFNTMPMSDDYVLAWQSPDYGALRTLLVDEYEFGAPRIDKVLETLQGRQKTNAQKGLGDFF